MPRAGITPDLIVEHAATIVDRDGLAALTLSRVADDLGVSAPSLYKHVAGLDDLIERVAVAATAELGRELGSAIRGKSGCDGLRALARAYRGFALRHPGTYPLTQRRLDSAPWIEAADDALDSLVAVLAGYGADADVDSLRVVRASVHGFVDLERSGGFGFAASVDRSFDRLIDALDASLREARPARETESAR